jgi:hypothetical protein
MADVFKTRQLLHFRETTFAEYAESSTPTWTRALPFNEATVTLEQGRIPDAGAIGFLSDALPGHHGPRRCTLRVTQYLEGLGAPGIGSITQTAQNILLEGAFGATKTNASGTQVATSSSASAFTLSSSTNWDDGTIGRMGDKTDTRGNGQAFVFNGSTGSYVALPGTPSVADIVYGTEMLWMDDSVANPVSERFLVMHSTTGAQFLLVGCALSSVEFQWKHGEIPTVTMEWRGVHWRTVARTYPDALVASNHNCAPVTGGSLFINNAGTATRAIASASEVNLSIDLGLEPVLGGAPTGTFQDTTQWARTRRDTTVEIKIPWATTYQTWFDTTNTSLTFKHLLWTANATGGVANGFYAPYLFPDGNRPSTVIDVNGQNYVSVMMRAGKNAQANTIKASPLVIFQG